MILFEPMAGPAFLVILALDVPSPFEIFKRSSKRSWFLLFVDVAYFSTSRLCITHCLQHRHCRYELAWLGGLDTQRKHAYGLTASRFTPGTDTRFCVRIMGFTIGGIGGRQNEHSYESSNEHSNVHLKAPGLSDHKSMFR